MNEINVKFTDDERKYITIYKTIKNLITEGKILPDEKIPSKRKLSTYLNVAKNTVMYAYDLLESEGYVYVKDKSGYYVENNRNYSKVKPSIYHDEVKTYAYDFTSQNIDVSLFPFYTLRKISQEIMADNPSVWLKKSPNQGSISLRMTLAKYLYENKGMEVNENNIIIVSSLNESLKIISSLIDIKNFGTENPTYLKVQDFFKDKKVTLFDVNDEGIVLDKKQNLDLIYVTPYNQYPTGVKMTTERRKQLLEYPTSYILEDDFDSDLISKNKVMSTLYSLNNEKVIYHGSFSHTFCPGIRISYLVLPNALMDKYHLLYKNSSSDISSLDQELINKFINEGYYYRHLTKLKKSYLQKKNIIREYLDKNHLEYKETALSFLVKCNKNNIEENIKSNHIHAHFLSDYYLGTSIKDDYLIISYYSVNYTRITEGLVLMFGAGDEDIAN